MDLYARPSKLLVKQLLWDLGMALWVFLFIRVAQAVYWLVNLFAAPARKMGELTKSMSDGLVSAADSVGEVPLVGDTLRVPFDGLSGGLAEITDVASSMVHLIETAALVVAIVVFAVPVVWLGSKWLPGRLEFWRNSPRVKKLAKGLNGERLFALRALATAPLTELAAVNADPMGAWLADDRETVRRLAAIELGKDGFSLAQAQQPAKSTTRWRRRLTSGKVVDD
ncbi:MAG: hypothetical protein LBH11_00240 [Propionibacteriaceae bacterium]|jgi:hypothetical protein|nr:hypothetical protein [Propionibacteriaceae bacterium]